MSYIDVLRGTAAVLLATHLGVANASHANLVKVSQQPKFHIRLVDMAGLDGKTRTQAEAVVQALFRKAGVQLEFVECATAGGTCSEPPGESDFWLQILNRELTGLARDACGFAMLLPSDSYAAVSLPQVQAAAVHLEVAVSDMLAASMAHEIGHLLLHSTSHSANGIMARRLERHQLLLLQRGELTFTIEEASRLAERARTVLR